MTLQQGLSFAVVLGMMALFAWDRWRYDVVALLALVAALACGIVPVDKAFSGFGNPLLPLIASVLVMSAAMSKTGLIEITLRPLTRRLHSTTSQVVVFTTTVAFLSAIVKNVGALSMLLPMAMQTAAHSKRRASDVLMPMSFASLLGGTMTLIGTSPNLIVASVRQELLGAPYRMLDFLPVGFGATLVGIAFLTFGWRLVPRGRKGQAPPQIQYRIEEYLAEAKLSDKSSFVGRTVAELEDLGDGELAVAAIVRQGDRRFSPRGTTPLSAGDVLLLQCDPQLLARIVPQAGLELLGGADGDAREPRRDDLATVEAVVMSGSPVIGATIRELRLQERHGVSLLAVTQRGLPTGARLRHARLQSGDVVALHGLEPDMPDALTALGLLPLAERQLALGHPRRAVITVALLLTAIVLAATETVPAAVAFLGAATIVAARRILTLREIYAAIDWPVLVLLGALIPIGEAVRDTHATDLVAAGLGHVAVALPAFAVIAVLIALTMAVTPFLHHAAAVLVMAPIAVNLAQRLGIHGDPLLMAITLGASCDFLTPIGHQCNTLVMGPGGYRFGDYWRLGLPLSGLVVLSGTALIAFFWPVH